MCCSVGGVISWGISRYVYCYFSTCSWGALADMVCIGLEKDPVFFACDSEARGSRLSAGFVVSSGAMNEPEYRSPARDDISISA
jgi:hypothetical protein